MARRPVFRLAEAVLLFLLLLFPMMLMLGIAEGTARTPTPLFWLFWLLPVLVLPWLRAHRNPDEAVTTETEENPEFVTADEIRTTASELGAVVAPVVDVTRVYVRGGLAVAEGQLRAGPSAAFEQLEALLAPRRLTPLLESAGDGLARVIALPIAVTDALRRRSKSSVNVLLFLATVITTIWAGALHQGVNLLLEPARFGVGVPYAAALLGILGVHEMGHFIVARRYRVDVTWPYFIPVPMGLGTLGAFIQIKSPIKSRRAVFDVGIAGPLAGLIVALPALYIGLGQAAPLNAAQHLNGTRAGSSILLALVYQSVHGGDLATAAGTTIRLSPVAFAGWIGLIVTALNLLPVGQLDGGHIAYGLLGRRYARAIGVGTFMVMVGLGLTVWPGLLTWAVLVMLIAGFSHIPALDDITPPDGKRFAVGGLAMLLLAMIVFPLPAGFTWMMLDCPYF
jgi:membrane-associated protease RseP (regulator of RpoE activity)